MTYLVVCAAAFAASVLTFFSGFGLGTLLLPVFAIFFPVDLSVGLVAVVHLLNNFFKLALVGRYADRKVVLTFGAPALVASYGGALSLVWLSSVKPLWVYSLSNHTAEVTLVKLVIAFLILVFAWLEMVPRLQAFSFDKKFLPAGGLMSGFLGGLSGHQGALRSAFLVRCGLNKEAFIGTGVAIAVCVDVARIAVYAGHFGPALKPHFLPLLSAATGAAFLGAWLGSRLTARMTIRSIQWIVSVLLFAVAGGLAAGII